MKIFRFIFFTFLCLAFTPVWGQDAFSYAQKEFTVTFTMNGNQKTTSCQAVRIHKNWFLTAAHCVSPCKNHACQIKMWLALGPAKAGVGLNQKNVFLPDAYEDEYTLPPGVKLQKKLQPWDMALIHFVPAPEDFVYYDADGRVKKADFLLSLSAEFWKKKAEETRQEANALYARARSLAEEGQTATAREMTEAAQEMEQEIEEYLAAVEAAPELNRQWQGAVNPRLAPLLTFTDPEERILLSNILVPRWVRGAFENRSSPSRVTYFGDKQAVWISNGFGVTPGNSGGGVFLPVYNGSKKQTSGLVGTVSARSLNMLPDSLRSHYELPGQELFLFIGFSEGTTLGFIRGVMNEFRQEPDVRPLTKFGRLKKLVPTK